MRRVLILAAVPSLHAHFSSPRYILLPPKLPFSVNGLNLLSLFSLAFLVKTSPTRDQPSPWGTSRWDSSRISSTALLLILALGLRPMWEDTLARLLHSSLSLLLGYSLWTALSCFFLQRSLGFFTRKSGNEWFTMSLTNSNARDGVRNSFTLNVAAGFFGALLIPVLFPSSHPNPEVLRVLKPACKKLPGKMIAALAPCVLAPCFEELLFRGFALPAMATCLPRGAAILFSGALFSLIHLDASSFVSLWVFGAFLGWLYVKCGNLLVPIFVHALWNFGVLYLP
jgi:membrane protease YdiL (CAAX protease family)